jgi:hypothetical protein
LRVGTEGVLAVKFECDVSAVLQVAIILNRVPIIRGVVKVGVTTYWVVELWHVTSALATETAEESDEILPTPSTITKPTFSCQLKVGIPPAIALAISRAPTRDAQDVSRDTIEIAAEAEILG